MPKSEWDKDMDKISWIQFRSGWSQKKRNKEISKLERKMEKIDDLELEPNTPRNRTGYYDQYATKKKRKSLEDTWGI